MDPQGTQNDPPSEDGVVVDGRYQHMLQDLNLDAAVRALGIEPSRVVVLPELPSLDALVTPQELKDGPFGAMLQAAAATAVSMGAAAQRLSDELRAQAEADAQAVCEQARQEAERIQAEAYEEARRIRADARRRAYARRLGARLHADVEDHEPATPTSLHRLGRRQLVLEDPGAEWRLIRATTGPRRLDRYRGSAKPSAPRRPRNGVKVLVALAGASALVLGSAAALTSTTSQELTAAALDLGDAERLQEVPPVGVLADTIGQRPEQAGTVGEQLVGALNQVQALPPADRRNRALGLASDIERAVRDGRLTPETERLVRPALLRESTPDDLAGLVALLRVRALGAGPDGPRILQELEELGPDPSPAGRARFMRSVRASADAGRLTSAFRVVAADVVEGR